MLPNMLTHGVLCGCLLLLLSTKKNRVLRLLERAPRSIKLVSDSEPLQVVHEDTHFLAVSKPPGLRSAPVHRFLGGSVVNRMIGHLGTEPYLLHRCMWGTCRCLWGSCVG
jgi:23S rRNA-/tRNA-specific pseudouridylate synthase